MTDNADLVALTEELAALRARVDELTAATAPPPDDPAVSRRHLLRTLAGLGAAGAATAAGIATADPAAADDGDNLFLGQDNTASSSTTIRHEFDDRRVELLPTFPQSGTALVATGTGDGGVGVYGRGSLWGVHGQNLPGESGVGVVAGATGLGGQAFIAISESGPAIQGISDDGVTLFLQPTDSAGPPATSRSYQHAGSFSVDADTEVWLKIGDGEPGTWTRLLREDTTSGRVIPITPMRVLDTRTATGKAPGGPVVPGQVKGPLKGGQVVTLDLAGITPIPANATGIIGNATVITPTATGFLRLLPAGATIPASSFNFTTGTTIANGFTSALNPTGITAIAPVAPSVAYHLVLDIAAYIT